MLDDHRHPMWTPWGSRLVAVLAVCLAVAAAWWWFRVFYLNDPLNSLLSFSAFDHFKGRAPNVSEPIVGRHFFGDFQESRGWGLDILSGRSPYRMGNIYLPLAPILMVPFAAIGLDAALAVYLVVAVAMVLIPVWLLLRDVELTSRIVITVILAVFTTPTIALVDRGNLQALCIGLVGFALVGLQRGWIRTPALLLALTIAIKPYFIVLLVVPLALRRFRFAAMTVVIAVLVALVGMLMLPGGVVGNLALYAASQTKGSGASESFVDHLPHNFSPYAFANNVVHAIGAADVDVVISALMWVVFGLLWLAAVMVVVRRHRVPQWCWGPLALASIQMTQPYAYGFSLSFASLAAVWFAADNLLPSSVVGGDAPALSDGPQRLLRVLVLVSLVIALTPIPVEVRVGGNELLLGPLASPVLWTVTAAAALVVSYLRPVSAAPTVGAASAGN